MLGELLERFWRSSPVHRRHICPAALRGRSSILASEEAASSYSVQVDARLSEQRISLSLQRADQHRRSISLRRAPGITDPYLFHHRVEVPRLPSGLSCTRPPCTGKHARH